MSLSEQQRQFYEENGYLSPIPVFSDAETAEFHFRDGSMDINIAVTRSAFEGWIAEELLAIEQCVDSLLETSGVSRRQVDRVAVSGPVDRQYRGGLISLVADLLAHRLILP